MVREALLRLQKQNSEVAILTKTIRPAANGGFLQAWHDGTSFSVSKDPGFGPG